MSKKAGYFALVVYRDKPMKILLIQTSCKRCGSNLTMYEYSLFGADELKKELGQICGNCLTPEEIKRIVYEVMEIAMNQKIQHL